MPAALCRARALSVCPPQVVVLADTEESIKDLPPGEADAQERKPFKLKARTILPFLSSPPAAAACSFRRHALRQR